MGTKGQHVVPNGGKWSVRKAGASKVTKTFRTQKEAISEARETAKKERDSYGNDPVKSKG
jgi:hypothetical protein